LYVWKQLSPSRPQHLDIGVAYGMTDIGNVRPSNEDNFLIDPELGLVAVADGMGGHEAGEIASAEALVSLSHFLRASVADDGGASMPDFKPSAFDPAENDPLGEWSDASIEALTTVHHAVEFTNQRMYQTNMDNKCAAGGGMGTTLTGLWQAEPGGPVYVFHIGDSRLYRLRDGVLIQLTRDQTVYQQALELGMRHNLPRRNLLLQAMGPSSGVKPELQIQLVAPGDLYLLCSDGLHGASVDADIAAILVAATPSDLGATCARLIDMAKQRGSRDNITVVLLQCKH
jgi:serine/threonine protein phosphatase PrpC